MKLIAICRSEAVPAHPIRCNITMENTLWMGSQPAAVGNGAQFCRANTDIEVKRCKLVPKHCSLHGRVMAESPVGILDF